MESFHPIMITNGFSRISAVILSLFLLILTGCGPSTPRISIYDRFLVSSDDIITDIVTGFQWKVGPDKDFDWYAAGTWIESLEADWRMPMHSDLEELFNAGITTETWGPFENNGWVVWSIDYSRRDMSYPFYFIPNDVFLSSHYYCPAGHRVFAVLYPAGYGMIAKLTSVPIRPFHQKSPSARSSNSNPDSASKPLCRIHR